MPRSKSTGDAMTVRELIEWARASGVDLTKVTVGVCSVDVAPSRQPVAPRERKPPEPTGIYQTFGGEVIRDTLPEVGDEYAPAIGRRA